LSQKVQKGTNKKIKKGQVVQIKATTTQTKKHGTNREPKQGDSTNEGKKIPEDRKAKSGRTTRHKMSGSGLVL